jgi:hypothetical protein
MWLPSHSRLLRRNDDGFLDAFKIARGHVGVRVFALEIWRGFDGQLLAVIIGPRLAVDCDLPAPVFLAVIRKDPRASSPRIAGECRRLDM